MNKKDFGYNTDYCCLTDREINQILMKENQLLKDRWQKLKEWVNQKPLRGRSVCFFSETILDKMQKLEQGETDAKD